MSRTSRFHSGALTWIALVLAVSGVAGWAAFAVADGDNDVQNALGDDQVGGKWIYDDIEAGYAKASETGKPLLVVFR